MKNANGFTLIELMVTMLISTIVLGGLMYSFIQQNSEYKYQNARVNAVQDLEFTLQFMVSDMKASLVSLGAAPTVNIAITAGAASSASTAALSFSVWDPTIAGNNRLRRCYLYRGQSLYLNRNFAGTCNAATSLAGFNIVLSGLSTFRVIPDTGARPACPNGNAFSQIPPALPFESLTTSSGDLITTNGFTLLLETTVNAGYKNGSFVDVCGIDTAGTAGVQKKITRYAQIYPANAVL